MADKEEQIKGGNSEKQEKPIIPHDPKDHLRPLKEGVQPPSEKEFIGNKE